MPVRYLQCHVHVELPSDGELSDIPCLSRGSSAVPRDLETICLKYLEKELGKRYETAAA